MCLTFSLIPNTSSSAVLNITTTNQTKCSTSTSFLDTSIENITMETSSVTSECMLSEVQFQSQFLVWPFELNFISNNVLCSTIFKEDKIPDLLKNELVDELIRLQFEASIDKLNILLKNYQDSSASLLHKKNIYQIFHGWKGEEAASTVKAIFGMAASPPQASDFRKTCTKFPIATAWYLYQVRQSWLKKIEIMKSEENEDNILSIYSIICYLYTR